ncbi:hypothetical protein FH609_026765 [Streptomyces sp. 3MP-14]|uniref:Uncharacterized protein n=1 Tax=Streptomyces mimosae TaxID=2586635 RepID=A0A5N5ZZU2_9ACTN|nr:MULTISPECIES: hypothetical protein [Streptomyces]KAB8161452.1 hypothetical protein FH607_025630 [Streptomyces mimosae]KAB8173224.1 hypothetical protein FH609_026765 [Streptomyces sp. 3MP-14]
MTADWLVCANCAGRVSEGRCAVCRAELARLRQERGPWAVLGTPGALIAILLGLAAVALLVARPA